ncbi:putative cyclin-dependent serine/threonine-protein kinase DDB_G0272797/DDB_G0274007 isoform X2 [Hyalella azteca]|uniref:Cyclin-dependent serine/threonine-protein kinase DDB_G0272797/DDB_G0274007 isoform X2 n=1 Tax=Hyalella azteca TaxID=294128 RepID=A0A8B7NS81_HYAAZ|nr:putative cyclin-dependent serine/threonine-protein kinase DDB_G0272797/DDB_G0274007 isoform X2 [Hyalella azteca]
MDQYFAPLCLLLLIVACSGQHHAPPGVNPQQYQAQQAQQQQYQQQQYQQQNAPGVPPQQYQQQQVPHQQQQQFQQPTQQQFQQPAAHIPQQQQQHLQQQQQHLQQQPHDPHNQQVHGQRMLHKQSLSGERDHIKDHLEVPLDTSGMSEQELQFHYFKMHDADNNNKLDGQELIKSLFHWHDADNHDPSKKTENGPPPPTDNKLFSDEELVTMIDPILEQDDHNKDGYIDYTEFMAAQQKAAVNTPQS